MRCDVLNSIRKYVGPRTAVTCGVNPEGKKAEFGTELDYNQMHIKHVRFPTHVSMLRWQITSFGKLSGTEKKQEEQRRRKRIAEQAEQSTSAINNNLAALNFCGAQKN